MNAAPASGAVWSLSFKSIFKAGFAYVPLKALHHFKRCGNAVIHFMAAIFHITVKVRWFSLRRGQVAGVKPTAKLFFSPVHGLLSSDLVHATRLANNILDYNFFGYQSHLPFIRTRKKDCAGLFSKIQYEFKHMPLINTVKCWLYLNNEMLFKLLYPFFTTASL